MKQGDASQNNMRGAFGSVLRGLRGREGIKQQKLASELNVHRNTIGAWERGEYLPDLTSVHEIVRVLSLYEHDAKQLFEAHSTNIRPLTPWNLPARRNLFFTGREQVLQHLHEALQHTQDRAAQLTQSYALSGLGGIGKTQTALEYAYRFQDAYQSVFWVQAESSETMIASYLAIAESLNLPEKSEPDQNHMIKAVLRWLNTHVDWLLVYDNVEDFETLKGILPAARSGAILLTTRAQATGSFFQSIQIEQMVPEEAALFLVRRAKILKRDSLLNQVEQTERLMAAEIAERLAWFPLALDQAGAYIEEHGCSLKDYLALYQTHRSHLLQARGGISADHPSSVATTFLLAFEQLQRRRSNPSAADLLRLCAFLAPDAIPQELIKDGAAHLGPLLQPLGTDLLAFNAAFKAIMQYSLIQRTLQTNTFSIHRLVQAVLKDGMDEDTQRLWTERAIRALNHVFPDRESPTEQWPLCERLVPHVLVLLDNSGAFAEAALLFMKAAAYLQDRGHYPQAEELMQRTLAICKQCFGSSHPQTVESLNNLGILYRKQGRYQDAERLYRQALTICEQEMGPAHILTAESLDNLAILCWYQGKYQEAEQLLLRVVAVDEQMDGPCHHRTAISLSNLALVYTSQGRYTEAEALDQRSLQIREQILGPSHLITAISLSRLAVLYRRQGKYGQAEQFSQRVLAIREQELGPAHVITAFSLSIVALLHLEQGRYGEAEHLFQRALTIHEHLLGPSHPDTIGDLVDLAELYRRQGKYEKAVPLCQQALAVRQQVFGPNHPRTAENLTILGMLYRDQEKYAEAESLLQQALEIYEHALASSDLSAVALNALGVLYRDQGRHEEAEAPIQRALSIRQEQLGPNHPHMAESLYDLALLRQYQSRYADAAVLCQSACSVAEQALGKEHPLTCKILQKSSHLSKNLHRL